MREPPARQIGPSSRWQARRQKCEVMLAQVIEAIHSLARIAESCQRRLAGLEKAR